jgi:uncharacterized membrane protein
LVKPKTILVLVVALAAFGAAYELGEPVLAVVGALILALSLLLLGKRS